MRVWVLYGVTLAIVGAWGVMAWQERGNGLDKHEGWIATKATHEINLMGAGSFVSGPQALSGNRLNLHAWHGFQEVWRNVESSGVDGVGFDVYLGPEAYVCFWWGSPEGPRHAVVLSNRPGRSGGFMVMDGEGRFLERDPRVELDELGSGWQHVNLNLAKARLEVGAQVFELPAGHRGTPAVIGFRGGREAVSIDNVHLLAGGKTVYSENFFNDRRLIQTILLSLLGVMLFLGLIEYLVRRMNTQSPFAARVSLCVSGIIIASAAFAYVRLIETRSYPDMSGRMGYYDEAFRNDLNATYRDEFELNYGSPEPKPEGIRVLFLGGSQTWGAGASLQERCFVSRIETLLTDALARPVKCLNGGLRSARTDWLAEQLAEWLVAYNPDLLVLNVSSNDNDITEFGMNLAEIARICDRHAIPLLVVCEAESPEFYSNVEVFHTALRSVAARLGIIAVEAHAYLREHDDTGMVWWDHVHPTDYGHALLAECIYPAVYGVLHAEKLPERPPITRLPRNR